MKLLLQAEPNGMIRIMVHHPISSLSPAGPRMLRLNPPHGLKFVHDTEKAAARDMERLADHITNSPSLKGKGKKRGGYQD